MNKNSEYESLRSIGDRLHNISVELHYSGNENLSDELSKFSSLLWYWDKDNPLEVYSKELRLNSTITLEELINSHKVLRKARLETNVEYMNHMQLGYNSGYQDGLKNAQEGFIHISQLRNMTLDEIASIIMIQE